ncbi:transcriptional regulator, luxR family [Mycolicibacterium chubuense NBB4]|uniref:Transcriptional regulator, luxR family n=1 Tax=Mycolicibacterium chubuense (strain NBB4) TaxID=710421 RepID=I4BPN5_MYCCN|nr:helix-turn-helix transcriptional regulator [Mycolicibacterium chubuense]AFM19242.1 transcriptional regulator, luxR family [Mycolicibacterium chubuense NBB4]
MAQWVPPPLPAELLARRRGPFVGRAAELSAFEHAWEQVDEGRRHMVFIGGEPGAGKSRLVAEIAGTLADHGVAVLVGSSTADAGVPYEPFAEALDRLLSAGPAGCLAEPLADAGPQLERLSALVHRHLPGAESTDDAGTVRRVLFDALTGFLRRLAAHRPIALILEDLHWAQLPTLAMLEHVLATCADIRLLIVATFRTTAPDRSDELVSRVAEMHRFDGVRRLDLEGLDTEAITEFVSRTQQLPPPTARTAAALLRDRTGGNPFFLTELCHHLGTRGGLAALSAHQTVPASIGDAITRRLTGLGAGVQAIIEQAAVLGETFDLPALIAGSDTDVAATLAAVDSAEAVGLIRAVQDSDGEFAFVHALTREAVVARMAPSRLRIMHARAAEALEGRADPAVIPRLANHYLLAHVLGFHEQALRYARKAAAMAERSLAYEDAATWYGRAASLPELDMVDRARLNLSAAGNHVRAGDFARARSMYESISAIDDPLVRLEAAVGYEDANWRPGLADSKAADLLASALESCGLDVDDPRYVRALGSFGRALAFAGETARARDISNLAIDHARRIDDRAVIVHALETSLWHGLTPDMCEHQLERSTELSRMALSRRDYEALGSASHFRALASYQAGRAEELAASAADMQRAGRASGQPFFNFVGACAAGGMAYLRGDFDGAERWAEIALRTGGLLGGDTTEGSYGVQMFMIRRETGALKRFSGFVDGSETFADRWVPGLLALYTEIGCERGMTRALNQLLSRDLGSRTEAAQWPMELVFMTEAALALGEREAAAVLRPFVARYEGKNIMSGQFVAIFGSADRYLARIADLAGDHDAAEAHFAVALEMDRRMNSTVHVAETLARQALFEDSRGHGADARRLADEARAIAAPIGQTRVLDLLDSMSRSGPDGLTDREIDVLRLLAEGLSNRAIGERLYISTNTAANHVRSILLKTGAANRTQAAMYAADHELLA